MGASAVMLTQLSGLAEHLWVDFSFMEGLFCVEADA
jgi:hypothetical protein